MVLFYSILMAPVGQTLTQISHSTQASAFTRALPLRILIASAGQLSAHSPQPVHKSTFTFAAIFAIPIQCQFFGVSGYNCRTRVHQVLCGTMMIAWLGHCERQAVQAVQRAASTTASCCSIRIAPAGQMLTQTPQPVHFSS